MVFVEPRPSVWQGAATGFIVSAFNHVAHEMQKPNSGAPWDLNGDGKLSKLEADIWWGAGEGRDITVDNSNIDWSGLEIPKGIEIGEFFSIETVDAFTNLPLETAATYGGTSFKRTATNKAEVQDQLYHYDLRNTGGIKNEVRDYLTKHGKFVSNGVDYMIKYSNRTINFTKYNVYKMTYIPLLNYSIKKKVGFKYKVP